ncbi:MAG: hypothetical protein ACJASR_000945 [Psychroserpens sp.]|jgi:hypothetical protein
MTEKTDGIDDYLNNHYLHRSNWLGAVVLGANDGILSVASMAIGVAFASDTLAYCFGNFSWTSCWCFINGSSRRCFGKLSNRFVKS